MPVVDSTSASLPDRAEIEELLSLRTRCGGRGELRAPRSRRVENRPRTGTPRRRAASPSWPPSTASSATPASSPTLLRRAGRPSCVAALRPRSAELAGSDRGRQARPAATGAASGVAAKYLAKPDAANARRDRLRLAGREPGRVHPRGVPGIERSSSTAAPRSGSTRSAGRRRRARRDPARRPSGHRRHRHDLEGPGAPRRVARPGRARLRGRRERPGARASSTTSCSSAPRSSAATRSSRRGSSRAT